MTETVPEKLQAAVGSIVTAVDEVTAAPVAGLMAAFGHDDPKPAKGDPLPPLWHGLFCTAKLPPARIGADGLAKDEGLLPAAADFPNKLFGGARYEFRRPLRIGEAIRKESEVMSFERKEGRTGAFVVGLVQHRIANADGVAVVEENDIIYRPKTPPSAGTGGGKPAPPGDAVWSRTISPDPVLMFRHSAVTFNSHRIHYDRDYVRERGYPGLLVQGTLIARLMMEMVRQESPGFDAASFAFRSGRPIYDDGAFTLGAEPLGGGEIRLWALDATGDIGMTARVSPRE
ncbi:MAG: MaoC family dehydratase N-terminal domain-containing protein [Alphaproteobacteria bacterium]